MENWTATFLPFALLLTRISAFVGSAPLIGSRTVPNRFKAGLVLVLTIFFGNFVNVPFDPSQVHWAWAIVMLIHELLCGLALGMATRLVFMAISQGGSMMGRAMGLALAQVMDPNSGTRSQPISLIFEMVFIVLFLGAGGHHVLIKVLSGSYSAFPMASPPQISEMANLIVQSGAVMLQFALRLAAPVLAGALLLSVVLSILARIIPEMNILFLSMPLRLALGLFIAAALLPTLDGFTEEIAAWMARNLVA